MKKNLGFQFNKGAGAKRKAPWRKALVITGSVLGGLILLLAIAAIIIWNVLITPPKPTGEAKLFGTYHAETEQTYVYREYEEYFTQEATSSIKLQNDNSAHGYYLFYDAYNIMAHKFCGDYDGVTEPEVLKAQIVESFSKTVIYTEEALAKCTLKLFLPVSEIAFRIDEVTVTETAVLLNGTLLQEEESPFSLSGTYTQAENGALSPVFTSEDATLNILIDKVFRSMYYQSFVDGNNVYVNAITFLSSITLKQ